MRDDEKHGKEVLNDTAPGESVTLGARTSLEEEHPINHGHLFPLDVLAASPEVSSLRLQRWLRD